MKAQIQWRTWDLRGLNVTQLRLDYQFHVHAWSLARDLLVTFGASFIFHSHMGESRAFNPEQSVSLCPLLPLLHRPLTEFAVSSEGECVLRFEDGSELRGEPHGTGELESASMFCDVGGGSPWG